MTALPVPVAVPRRRRRIDLGRVLLIAVCAPLLVLNAQRLVAGHSYAGRPLPEAVGFGTMTFLTAVFYLLILRVCLTRLPAKATSRSMLANSAAVSATWLPFVIPLLRQRVVTGFGLAIGTLLILCGSAWSIWALRTLGRSFSVIPQARAVVSTGPYAVVRHPLYLGEMISALGLAVLRPSPATFAAWALLCALQVYRAGHEERTLASVLPDYAAYAGGRSRLVPGLY